MKYGDKGFLSWSAFTMLTVLLSGGPAYAAGVCTSGRIRRKPFYDCLRTMGEVLESFIGLFGSGSHLPRSIRPWYMIAVKAGDNFATWQETPGEGLRMRSHG